MSPPLPPKFEDLLKATSIGREFEAFLDRQENIGLLGASKRVVLQVASQSPAFRSLLADLDERFVRRDEAKVDFPLFLSIDGQGWITKKASDPKKPRKEPDKLKRILERKKRKTLGSQDLGLVRALRLRRGNGYSSVKYPSSHLFAADADSDIITIDPSAPQKEVENIKLALDDDSKVTPQEIAAEFVASVAHEMRHSLVTYERDAARPETPDHLIATDQLYRELMQEEQLTRETSLLVASELQYDLPRQHNDAFLDIRDFRWMNGGYVSGLPFVQRVYGPLDGQFPMSQAELYLFDYVLKPRSNVKRFGNKRVTEIEAAALKELLRRKLVHETGAAVKKPGLKSWKDYQGDISKLQAQPKDALKLHDGELGLYTIVYVKAVLRDRRTTADFANLEDLTTTPDGTTWNAALEQELRETSDSIFAEFKLGYDAMYSREGIDPFLKSP